MITRRIHSQIAELLGKYPVVILVGPRGIGKSTVAKAFSDIYYDIEQEQDLTRLDIDWIRRMRGKEMLVLDEIQTQPELFLRLLAVIDEHRGRNGRFLLAESMASPLIKSLEGRYALCELPPLLISEVPEERWDDLWIFGGYPGQAEMPGAFPSWHQTYLERLSQRDLPNWGFPAPPMVTQRLFRMLASTHSQPWNASQIGKSLGVSYHTANTYVAHLERAGLIRLLPASTITLNKRLVKTPKLYWRDSGLLHATLGLDNGSALYAQPWVGASWEGWVIEQIIGHLHLAGHPAQASHFGTSDRYTIDLLLDHQGKRWAMNLSLSSAPDVDLMDRLGSAARLVGADHTILVSRTSEPRKYKGVVSLSLVDTLEMLGVL